MRRAGLLLLFLRLFCAGAQEPRRAYFVDGYHGGIYGHLPSWQARFMVDKLGQYPDWKINLELEPESWDSIALSDPDGYAAFQRLMADQTAAGRVEYVNPAYGQAYLYNISGESIIRQFEYGMKTLRRHFPGIVFSTYSSEEPCFTSALPQILRSFGFKYASLKNPNTCWGGYTRAFGGELVNWIGPDGSSMLTVPRYGIESLKPHSIWETIAAGGGRDFVTAAFADGIRHPVGMCLQDAGWNAGPWLRGGNYDPTSYVTWRGYFENIADRRLARDWRFTQEDVQVGLMWGSQVLQRIARAVRKSETMLMMAEKEGVLVCMWSPKTSMSYLSNDWRKHYVDSMLAVGWRGLLLAQHHDCWIVPYNGKPGDTWADKVVKWTGKADSIAYDIFGLKARFLSGDSKEFIRVFNTTGVARQDVVSFGSAYYRVKLPAMGYATVRAADSLRNERIRIWRSGGNVMVETDLYRLTIDTVHGGVIRSWIGKRLGNKEFVAGGKGFNELRGNFYNDGGMRSSTEEAATVEVLEDGAYARLGIRGRIAGHPFFQQLRLAQGRARVDVHLRIDWKGNPAIGEYFENPKDTQVRKSYYDDRFKLLALFPLALEGQQVYKNAPFDVVKSRLDNTFYNRWDSIKNNVLLNWVDVTDSAGAYGLALFSDHTTSYAHGVDFPLGLTVQYSGNGIFYRNYTIDGPTELNYGLMPHAGTWDQAGVWSEGIKFDEPLTLGPTNDAASRNLLTPDRGLVVSSMRFVGDSLLVRLFNAEAKGPTVKLMLEFSAAQAELVELDGRVIASVPVKEDAKGRRWVELKMPRFALRTLRFVGVKG